MDNKEQMITELKNLCNKNKLKNVSICGTFDDGEFFGLILVDKGGTGKHQDCLETILCVGRLWQHARTSARKILNSFETTPMGGW